MAPPVRYLLPPWDLNLVLSVLHKLPFENIWEIPLPTLSQKVAFLVAITSARRAGHFLGYHVQMDQTDGDSGLFY